MGYGLEKVNEEVIDLIRRYMNQTYIMEVLPSYLRVRRLFIRAFGILDRVISEVPHLYKTIYGMNTK